MARAIQTVTELRERAVRRARGDISEMEFRSQFSALLSRVLSHPMGWGTTGENPAGLAHRAQYVPARRRARGVWRD